MYRNKTKFTRKEFSKIAYMTGVQVHNAIRSRKIIIDDEENIDITNPINSACLTEYKTRALEKRKIKYYGNSNNLSETSEELEDQIVAVTSEESKIKLEREKAKLEIERIKVGKLYNDLIDKKIIERIFGKLQNIIRSMFLPIGIKTKDEICSILKDTTIEQQIQIRSIIDLEVSRALKMFIDLLNQEIENEKEE